MNLLDIITATETKNQAIQQVATNTNPHWAAQCRTIIQHIATTTDTFTTDDIWQALHDADLPTPHEPRAIGAILTAMARENLITATNIYRPSARPTCHARPIRVWTAR